MVKFLVNMKLAAYTGLVTGLLIGTIDSIARMVSLNFQWFELYQTLFFSSLITIIFFILLTLVVVPIRKIMQLETTYRDISFFYTISAVSFLLFFYGEITLNNLFFLSMDWKLSWVLFWQHPLAIGLTIGLVFILGIIYLIFSLNKQKILSIIESPRGEKIRNAIKNYVFIAIVFILVSFCMDIYLLSSSPSFKSSTGSEDFPNVLLITLDTVRADHLTPYGYVLNTTPNLDKLAKNSIVFENVASTSSWTLPSHASIFTGKYSFNHNTTLLHQKLETDELTLAEILKSRGYTTVGYVGAPYCMARYGLGQGFEKYFDRIDFFTFAHTFRELSIRDILNSILPINSLIGIDDERTSEEINRDVFKWLDENHDQTFFMFINFFDAHAPYNLGNDLIKQGSSDAPDCPIYTYYVWPRYKEIPDGFADFLVSCYDAELFVLDDNLGKLFDKLDELGIKDNTIIIVTADHGEEFYEHGGFDHGKSLYEEVIHVPLMIYYPKKYEPQRIKARVGAQDIFPTLLDTLQIEFDSDVDGMSLVPFMKKGTRPEREYLLSELYGNPALGEQKQRAVSSEDWKLIEVHPEKEYLNSSLFNLKKDPGEQRNLYKESTDQRKLLHEQIVSITGTDKLP